MLCYCKQCQRISGGPFLPFIDFKIVDLHWDKAHPDIYSSSDIAKRFYCQKCGSTLGMTYQNHNHTLGIVLGTFDTECDFNPEVQCHIFQKDKPAWYTVPDDGKPRYDRFDEVYAAAVDNDEAK